VDDDVLLPYRDLAKMYDEMVGNTAFECWSENFERLVNRYDIAFEVAADVACGTGLAVEYLSARCGRVYGVDRSPWMLEVARSTRGADNVILLEQTFTTLSLPEHVDLLTCNFDSLNYVLEEGELDEAFRRFASSLRPGGYAVFDMNSTRELEIEWGTQVGLHRTSVGLSIWESDWDPTSSINTLRMTNFVRIEGDTYRMSEETHRERSYDLGLLTELLDEAGFSWAAALDARGLGMVDDDTRRVQFVARC
jgi:ubiquinone/menaquinone biosynthesis C-methylase UbiE